MSESPVVRFHYIKSNAYRVIHVDGIVGGVTPSNLLFVSLFSERPAIPTVVEHAAIDLGGGRMKLGGESRREGKQGVVRDVEIGAIMTVDMARKLRDWLDGQIAKVEEIRTAAAAAEGEDGDS